MNTVNLIGRLVRNPQINYVPETQMCIARFTVAIDDGWGEKKKTNFIPVTVFGKKAESCERFLTKGKLVGVQGKIQTGSYEKNGQTIYTTDVVANDVEFLEWGEKKETKTEVPSGFNAVPDDEFMPFA